MRQSKYTRNVFVIAIAFFLKLCAWISCKIILKWQLSWLVLPYQYSVVKKDTIFVYFCSFGRLFVYSGFRVKEHQKQTHEWLSVTSWSFWKYFLAFTGWTRYTVSCFWVIFESTQNIQKSIIVHNIHFMIVKTKIDESWRAPCKLFAKCRFVSK